MINFTVLPISPEYISGYNQALDSVAREKKYLGFVEGPSIESSRKFAQDNIQNNRPHFIALADGKVVGWCDISSLDRPIFLHSGALGIGVIAEYRGKGIGEALLRATLLRAKEVGLTRVELTVRENNKRAISLYEKLGFVTEGLHRNAILVDNQYENQISMGLLF